jgi:hypothetical protein
MEGGQRKTKRAPLLVAHRYSENALRGGRAPWRVSVNGRQGWRLPPKRGALFSLASVELQKPFLDCQQRTIWVMRKREASSPPFQTSRVL